MFKWIHEHIFEEKISINNAWDFQLNLTKWPKWIEEFESFTCEGELKSGSIISAKIKNQNSSINIFIKNLVPHQEFTVSIKVLFFTQESTHLFEKISPEITRITTVTTVKSFFTPFLKSYYKNKFEVGQKKAQQELIKTFPPS